jgi:ABC-2 type transport system ATP-binding protein
VKEYIQIQDLEKEYVIYERKGFRRVRKKIHALQGISLSLEKGSFLGYIGPNGAGKSTTVKILTGIMTPEHGTVLVNGLCPWKDRKRFVRQIGVVFGQKSQMWWDLPVQDTYQLLRAIYRVRQEDFRLRLAWVREMLELDSFFHQPVRQLSLGQRMRAELGAAVLHKPDILFLDEPTIGLDLLSKQRVLDFLQQIHKEGTTVFLTTHDLPEIEILCQSILILNQGRIAFHGSLESLKQLIPLERRLIATLSQAQQEIHDQQLIEIQRIGATYEPSRRQMVISFPQGKNPAEIIRFLLSRFEIQDFHIAEPGIEEIVKHIYLG